MKSAASQPSRALQECPLKLGFWRLIEHFLNWVIQAAMSLQYLDVRLMFCNTPLAPSIEKPYPGDRG